MNISDEEMQRYIGYYEREKQKIPVNIAEYQKEVEDAEKELQAAIAAGDKRLIYGYRDILKQSRRNLISYEEYSSFLREPSQEDIQYRNRQRTEFPEKAESLPDDELFCFHGTTVSGAKHILLSGQISSGADRTGRATSFDPPGKISVTSKDTVDTSVSTYMNIDGNYCYPAGGLFVVRPVGRDEYNALPTDGWMIKNVDFGTEPDRLVSVITTPENIEKFKEWAKGGNIDPSKVMDFDAFIRQYSRQNEKNASLETQKGINNAIHKQVPLSARRDAAGGR